MHVKDHQPRDEMSRWVRRRWFDFRNGHSFYLVFTLAFMNFIIISYALALERVPVLQSMFPSMWQWAIFFTLIYLPTAVVVGYLHKKVQLSTDQRVMISHNPIWHKRMRIENAIADILEQMAKKNNMHLEIPRWVDEEMGKRHSGRKDGKQKTKKQR